MKESEFLARVRRANSSRTEWAEHPGRFGEPVRSWAGSLDEEFERQLVAAGGQLHRVKGAIETRRAMRRLLESRGFRRAAVTGQPLLRKLDLFGMLRGMRLSPVQVQGNPSGSSPKTIRSQLVKADVGITAAEYGLASTGTVVLAASPWSARSASLLPNCHIALLPASQLLRDLGQLMITLKRDYREGLPSSLTLVTGPSRTADIEQTLTIGIHGPGELHVFLVDGQIR